MTFCALQFDGGKYAIRVCGATESEAYRPLEKLEGRFSRTWQMSQVEEENWATFFILQRGLCKWGYGFFSHKGKYNKMAALLFLHLYTKEVPPHFMYEDYPTKWRRVSIEDREECAAFLRKWLAGKRHEKLYLGGKTTD